MDKKRSITCEQCGCEFDSVEEMKSGIIGCSMCSKYFTLNECIKVLENVKNMWGIEKGGSLKLKEFNLSIVKTTKKTHINFLNQFVTSLNAFGCIELNQNKTIVTIVLDGDDLK